MTGKPFPGSFVEGQVFLFRPTLPLIFEVLSVVHYVMPSVGQIKANDFCQFSSPPSKLSLAFTMHIVKHNPLKRKWEHRCPLWTLLKDTDETGLTWTSYISI